MKIKNPRAFISALVATFFSLIFLGMPGDVFADGTETLGPPSIPIASGTGIVAAGTGLVSQPGTIDITVPAGAAINQVLLYWEGQMVGNVAGDNTIVVDGVEITGTLIGGPAFFFTAPGGVGDIYSSGYRADITGLGLVAPGANSLTVDGLAYTFANNGAGVLVIFNDGTAAGQIDVRDGIDLAFCGSPEPRTNTVPQTFNFTAAGTERVATLSMFISSVQGTISTGGPIRPSSIEVTVGGATAVLTNQLDSNDGEEWDTLNLPITIPAGADSLTVQPFSRNDDAGGDCTDDPLPASITWNAAGLAVPPGVPDIDIRKQEEGPDTRTFASGSDVTFEIEVTNTGTVDLTDVEVTDIMVPGCDQIIGDMLVGAVFTYSCTVSNVTASFENEACVAGQANGVEVEDCDPSTVEIIDIDIRKQDEGDDSRIFPPGSDVPFEIVVTNTGDEDLFNVEVTDAQVPGCDRFIGDLAAGASVSYTCIAPNVTQGFVNEACVTGERNGATVADCDPSTVVIQEVAIDIRKEAEGPDSRTFPSGSDVTFEIVVTNTGQADLSNVAVTDAEAPGCARNIGDLAAGDSVSYTCTTSNVTASFENIACVAGEALGITVTDCDPSTVEIIDIDIRKQAEGPDSRIFPPGSDVPFEIVVTNTGDEDLVNVMVTDILVPDCDRDIGFLASGESVMYTCTAPGVMMSFVNEACVTGERNGVTVEDCDPSTVEIEGGGQGCTPGFWKQTQHFDSWTAPLTPDTLFSDVFEDAFPGKTLLDVLEQGGGGLRALGRHTVAALLNAASPGVSYDLSVNDIIEGFNDVFPGGDYEDLKDLFEGFNEQGCPLD